MKESTVGAAVAWCPISITVILLLSYLYVVFHLITVTLQSMPSTAALSFVHFKIG